MAKKIRKTRTNVPASDFQRDGKQASPASKRVSRRQRRRQRSQMWLWIAGAVAIIVVAGLIYLNNASQSAGAPPVVEIAGGIEAVANTKGPADAEVVVMEFSDFQCPHCKDFAEGVEKQLTEEYVKPGLIRFEFKYFPLPGFEPGATWAANAAACASDQGKFWEMQAYLFQEQGLQGPNTFTQNRLRAMAKDLDLDSGQFNTCLSRETHRQEILDSLNLGRQLGVTGTPTVFVNGVKVDSSYAGIKAAIDAELAKVGQG